MTLLSRTDKIHTFAIVVGLDEQRMCSLLAYCYVLINACSYVIAVDLDAQRISMHLCVCVCVRVCVCVCVGGNIDVLVASYSCGTHIITGPQQ